MINEVIVQGSQSTTLHTFTVTTNGMNIIVSEGEYYRGGQELFSDADGGTITIPTTSNVNYEVYLMTDGITVFSYTDIDDVIAFHMNNQANFIDKLMWFTIGENVTTLDGVTINFLKVINNAN